MKKQIKNFLATTGLSLILLAVVAKLYQARFLCIETVFQAAVANVVIHAGMIALKRFESAYYLVEIAVELSYMLAVLVGFGWLFQWYSSTPLWVLVLLGISVYFIGSLIDIFRIRTDVDAINRELDLRKKEYGKISKIKTDARNKQ
ncbi:hypothetical protein [Diplocloster hominis]|uniref:hypothetical protein n=1 Tax=Diplocloster hominis TaxID=3079010 RepID=UPI0031BB6B6C